MSGKNHRLIVITGPTASGKTELAIRLATFLKTEIVNADSRQIYKEMPIGSAAPTADELSRIPHHLIGTHSVAHPLSAGQYEGIAIEIIDTLFDKYRDVILCGGSGLYIDAVLSGFDSLPEPEAGVRESLNRLLEEKGIAELQRLLREADPEYFNEVDQLNPRRLIRALEVCSTGIKYSKAREGKKKQRNFTPTILCTQWERSLLEKRIRARTESMIQQGLKEEARALLPYRNTSPLRTVGYEEMFDHLDGKTTLEEAVELINMHSRQYAKRQETWFRKKNCEYVNEANVEQALHLLRS